MLKNMEIKLMIFPDDTTPADMDECINDEDDYEKRKTAANIN